MNNASPTPYRYVAFLNMTGEYTNIGVTSPDNLARTVNESFHDRIFIPYGKGMCVERLLDGKNCYIRVHLGTIPFYDAKVKQENAMAEIERICARLSQGLPYFCYTIGIERQDSIERGYFAELPDIDSLAWIVLPKNIAESTKGKKKGKTAKGAGKSKTSKAKKANKQKDTRETPAILTLPAMPELTMIAENTAIMDNVAIPEIIRQAKLADNADCKASKQDDFSDFARQKSFLWQCKPVGKKPRVVNQNAGKQSKRAKKAKAA